MSVVDAKPVMIYRIVHFNNLDLLLQNRGLYCGNEMAVRHLQYLQIGHQGLTKNRSDKAVPVGPKGNLNDYIPFYFCPRSVMLFQIHTGQVPTYTDGQEPVIHLVSSTKQIITHHLRFVFTDMLAKLNIARFYDDLDNLSDLDWETIKSPNFQRRDDDPNRPSRKAAEFLVHEFVPWECIIGIGVHSEKWKKDCEDILNDYGLSTPVRTCTGWYF